jgi:hypothetical protein
VAPLTFNVQRVIERSRLHGSQHDSAYLKGIKSHIANSPPGEGPDYVLGSEVHQVPMAIVTRLVIQRMLLRRGD